MSRVAACLVVCLAFGCDGDYSGGGGGTGEDGVDAVPEAPPRLRISGTSGDGLRLREGPGDGDTLARIPEGCLVEPIGPPDLGWLPVRWRDLEGWIYGAYVEHARADDPDCE
jgi:hypothetical protein